MGEWRKRWGYEIATKPSAPGIFRLRSGGYIVAIRVRNRLHGGRVTKTEAMHGASLAEARSRSEELRTSARFAARGLSKQRMRWSAFAAQLYERKVQSGELGSPKSIERWDTTLRLHLIPAFGEFWCDEIRYADIIAWKDKLAPRLLLPERVPHTDAKRAAKGHTVRNPEYVAPSTANGWLSVLRTICRQMTAVLELGRDPAVTVPDFDPSLRRTYTHEKPNALTPEWARRFLEAMRERWPDHYAMTLLGFMTGLRPSTLRPLRRKGPEADVKWEDGCVLVRRSNAKGQIVVERTKTKKDQRIDLPPEVLDVLRKHAAALPDGPMEESELLFPATNGGLRARSVLDKPFRDVAAWIGLPFPLTPRAMRRTNKDLMRAVKVSDVVSKAISGHMTDSMHELYSTASSREVRDAIKAVGKVVAGKKKSRSAEENADRKRAGTRAGRPKR